eukprot:TRINITY_DN591_c0_g2_i1.p1 TRINITY_DN591_c0_g2~~TRINITY_DN591_c0_g2_i1.p1  ORF type:complete len:185 (+),score=42.83 TRINITY_DN591_c0_g2_i1:351-905(+)
MCALSMKSQELDQLSEDERRALRASRFANSDHNEGQRMAEPVRPKRLAHPGGPLATNKAAALARFLERKMASEESLSNLQPELVERAIKNAQASLAAGATERGVVVKHVEAFEDPEVEDFDPQQTYPLTNQNKNARKKNKKKRDFHHQQQQEQQQGTASGGLSSGAFPSAAGKKQRRKGKDGKW